MKTTSHKVCKSLYNCMTDLNHWQYFKWHLNSLVWSSILSENNILQKEAYIMV